MGGQGGGEGLEMISFSHTGRFLTLIMSKETALQSADLLPLILVAGDLVSSWEIFSTNSLGSHSWKKVP